MVLVKLAPTFTLHLKSSKDGPRLMKKSGFSAVTFLELYIWCSITSDCSQYKYSYVFWMQADMYSLGVMFFELWHPFGTAMERHVVLSDLKQKGILPPKWLAKFPEQAQLLQRLLSSIPSDRPSATELLQTAFPPRMENEMLDSKKFLLYLSLYLFRIYISPNCRQG